MADQGSATPDYLNPSYNNRLYTMTSDGLSTQRELDDDRTETSRQITLLKRKEWYFQDISYDQIELVLKQKKENAFLVTNGAFENQFVVYTRIKCKPKKKQFKVKTANIVRRNDGNSFVYVIEGKSEVKFPTVVSAVEEYVSLSEDPLVPAVELSVSTVESSISLRDNDIPPGYTAAATFPGVIQPLPSVRAKVNPKKGEDADSQEVPFDRGLAWESYDDRERALWSTHLHYYKNLHCCHPRNTCHCCFHRGFDSFGVEREIYDCRGTGPCCCLLLMFMYVFCCLFCCPCLFVTLCVCCLVSLYDEYNDEY